MGTCNSGGRGSSSGKASTGVTKSESNADSNISALEIYREMSRQYVEAQQKALNSGAYIFEYTDMNGKTTTSYRQGLRFVKNRQTMFESMFPTDAKKVYKDKFTPPNDWGIMVTNKETGEVHIQKKKKR